MKPPSFTHMPFSSLIGREVLLLWVREHLEKCNIQGQYLEFGVLNGESMSQSYFVLRDAMEKYVGFDSFEGLPELSEVDQKAKLLQPSFYEGNYKSKPEEFVRQFILSTGMPQEKLSLVRGFFEQSLTNELQKELLVNGKAAVVHLDVDLHVSTTQALEFLYPFLQTGTWLLCDDYWTYAGASSFGTQKALREFLERHLDVRIQEYCSYRGWSKAFIVEMITDEK